MKGNLSAAVLTGIIDVGEQHLPAAFVVFQKIRGRLRGGGLQPPGCMHQELHTAGEMADLVNIRSLLRQDDDPQATVFQFQGAVTGKRGGLKHLITLESNRQTAVNGDDLPGDIRGIWPGEEEKDPGQLFGHPCSPQGKVMALDIVFLKPL